MKNKYIAVLTAMLVFIQALSFSAGVSAWEQTGETVYSDRAAEIFDSLGINNYLSEENESVTRIQFVATLMSLMNIGEMTPGGKSQFSDVKGDFSGMLDFATELRVVSKGETFRPDDAITYSEAMKMCLVATGYEYECAASGGYPSGVMRVGYRQKLDRGISLLQNAPLTYNDAMTLFYNLMNVKLVNVVAVSQPEGILSVTLVKEDQSLLGLYYGVRKIEGIVTENSRSSLYASGSGTKSFIEIDSVRYYCNKRYEDLLGHNVVAFISDEKEEAIAAFSEKNNVTVIDGDVILGFGQGKVTYRGENDKKKSISLENDYDVLYNAKAYTGTINADFLSDCEYISFIDNDMDNQCDVISLTDISYTLVEKVNYVDKIIYTHSEVGANIDLSKDKGQYTLIDKDGNEINIYKVETDMLLEAAVSSDGLYAMVRQSDKMLSGSITATDFENQILEIDGIEYKTTKEFATVFRNLTAGTKGIFYIGTNGKVVAYKKSSGKLQYGYIIDIGKTGSMGGYQIKMLCENGQINVFELAKNPIVDTERKTAKEAYSIIENSLASKLIKFRTDDDGNLKLIDTALRDDRIGEEAIGTLTDDSLQNENSLIMYFADYTGSYTYKASPKSLQPKVNLAGAKVFSVPVIDEDLDDETKYKVTGCDIFTNDFTFAATEVELFDVDKFGNCGVMLYKGDVTKTSVEDSNSAVIERIRYERNSEGDFAKCLRLLINGKYESYFIGKEIDESALKGGKALCVGDIIRFKAENDTLIAIKVDFDSSIDVMAKTSDIPDDRFNAGNQKYHYQAGKIYSINDKIAYFDLDSEVKSTAPTPINERVFSFEWKKLSNFSIPKNTVVKVKIYVDDLNGAFKEKGREVSIADLSEVESYLEKGENADYAVLRQNAFEGRLLVVYKFEN